MSSKIRKLSHTNSVSLTPAEIDKDGLTGPRSLLRDSFTPAVGIYRCRYSKILVPNSFRENELTSLIPLQKRHTSI
jgi:hypothetical protein